MSDFAVIGGERPAGFTLCGQQFKFRGIPPAKYSEWLGEMRRDQEETEEEQPTTWSELCDQADALVLLGLHEEDHDRYRTLRAGENGTSVIPTVGEIIALRNWIMEVETGRPPLLATVSTDTPGSTEPSSEGESSQEEETQDG